MAFTFSIRKGYEILLEITANEEVLSQETILPHLIQRCFERVFQVIEEERRQENEVVLGDTEEDDKEETD